MNTGAARAATTAADPRFADAHRQLAADTSIQFDLAQFVAPKPPVWLKPLFEFLKAISPAFPYLFWGALAIAVVMIGYLIATNLDGIGWSFGRRKERPVEEAAWQPDADVARALLAEAEALAAQGRYAEAARLLLRRSVADIAERLPQFLKPSLTARDIAVAPALPERARPAFAAIARVVEVSAFGSQSVNADAWADCRRAYGDFAIAGNWAHG